MNIRKVIRKIIEENYPTGAEFDSKAPWRDIESKIKTVKSYEVNLQSENFKVILDDGEEVYIDIEPVIEKYFADNVGSFQSFEKMFPNSQNPYLDIVQYLTGQGYDFTNLLQEEVEKLISNGEMNAVDENIATIKNKNFVIYQAEINSEDPEHPKHLKVDYAESEDEAIEKVKRLEQVNPSSIYYYDKTKPATILSKFNLNN